MSSKIQERLLLNFERPLAPVFVPKGKEQVFDVPEEYLDERYKGLQNEIAVRFSEEIKDHIPVKEIKIPDLSVPMALGRRSNFSLFISHHRQMASALIKAFMEQPTVEDFISLSLYAHDRINPFLYIYAYSVAILHRPDTRNTSIPTLAEVFPEKYMDSVVLSEAREQSAIVPAASRKRIEIPRNFTASDLDEEHRVAYFREDVGVNLHHWHWHLVYPNSGPQDIVKKDRRGELFYYMHQQILGRYNFERFSVSLARVKRLLDLREPIPEGYFPKLDSMVSSRGWAGRSSNTILSNVNREADQLKVDIQDLERWRDRFYQAIHSKYVVTDDGKVLSLDNERGIDLLGDMMESSTLSVNQTFYGDLHNMGHVVISVAHDPDHRHLEAVGVMGDPATGMRDPVFYRWHAFVDDIFQEHKKLLPSYTVEQLSYSKVEVTSVEIITPPHEENNTLFTHWQKSDIDLSRGMDFTPTGKVYASFTHLQHEPFSYRITYENRSRQRKAGTCRIFLAPKFDERELPFLFNDQKGLFIEMDKFPIPMEPGTGTYDRESGESSVIIPFETTFRDLEAERPTGGSALEEFNFCGCGWPQHMLVPRGTAAGLPCQLFVMISDYEDDKVDQSDECVLCEKNAGSYCGLRDKKYPDKKAMGYPFDRPPRPGVNTLAQFLTPNMKVEDVKIVHSIDIKE